MSCRPRSSTSGATARNARARLRLHQAAAVATAGRSATSDFEHTSRTYRSGWTQYDEKLPRPRVAAGLSRSQRDALERTYYLSANVLKASEDKTFPGAVVASLASPWGQAVSAGDPANTYFGSYREVFARDLYESFTGLVATGDLATAKDTVRFLFDRQQQPDGSMPRNSLVNGKTAPDSFGAQLDEVAYPILMARTVGLTDAAFYRDHIKRAADFVVAHGPAFGNERWEEQSGYSPSTIAAEIAGLAAAGAIAEHNGDAAGARIYRATADHYQRMIKTWTVTTNGPLDPDPYFIRLSKNGDPNAATTYNLGNGGPDADQRAVMDAGFLELPRLGVLAADDADVARSWPWSTRSSAGPPAAGRASTATARHPRHRGRLRRLQYRRRDRLHGAGQAVGGRVPEPGQNQGSGHLWPVLSGERAEHEIATGSTGDGRVAVAGDGGHRLRRRADPRAGLGEPRPGRVAVRHRPECASIGFQNGKAVGSASPLTWSAAQFVRLARDLARDGSPSSRRTPSPGTSTTPRPARP